MQNFIQLHSDNQIEAERLVYIDFKLLFTGSINRSDLKDAFGIKDVTSSNLLKQYKEKSPQNMAYTPKLHANSIVRDTFTPMIKYDAETALGMLANGFNKNKLIDKPMLPYARGGKVKNQFNVDDVAKITRAINGNYTIRCRYISENSRNHNVRELAPLALLFDGRTWIFRAFDRTDRKFKHFNFSRVVNPVEQLDVRKSEAESLKFDREWNTMVPLFLKLHPNIKTEEKKEVVRMDFGMEADSNELIVTERASMLWILEKQWLIDTSETPYSGERFYRFYLANKDMVDDIIEQFE